jgi:hypothetical protein
VSDYCENSNATYGSAEGGEFLDQLNLCQLFNEILFHVDCKAKNFAEKSTCLTS